MKNYFFDLDGTIINSEPGIKNAFRYTFDKLGMETPDDATLTSFIGPSLEATFSKLGDSEFAELAVKTYREYYGKQGMFEAEVYPQILETMKMLRQAGKKVYVATSKNEPVAIKTFEAFKMNDFVDGITGSGEGKFTKTLVLAEAMDKAGASKEDSVMIGDRSYDIVGGQENDVKTVGVLYGFGDYEELKTAGADFIIENPKELLELF
ncbi:HAD hydrolase-like protein [Floricoccus penangensis]|uniref:HAD hydrolase-like protein n=1 Tax=Floricoccus penangensis TaxID=1859475 RepID=UPI00203C2A66|nr:HAD hydrolase-like protein [Floricoccus penangensis]URZ87676.1 HAD hydrolase-like protein [Floricoccus penangensis]